MNYRLINGQICCQINAGGSWLPLSKQEANDLLDRLGDVHAMSGRLRAAIQPLGIRQSEAGGH